MEPPQLSDGDHVRNLLGDPIRHLARPDIVEG